jgi:multidrug efflux pump subunit AcrB
MMPAQRPTLYLSPAINVRDDWGNDALPTHLDVDQDQASLAGLSSQDIAISSYSAVSGIPVGVMREGRKNIPIVQLMNYGQRDKATALNQLYVYSGQTPQNITLGQVAKLTYTPEPIEIHRVNQYRAITVSALPKPGHVAFRGHGFTDACAARLRNGSSRRIPDRDRR